MRRKKLLIAIVLLAIGGYFGYNYLYQDHRDIQTETAAIETTGTELLSIFQANDSPEILNKTVAVRGIITQADNTSVTIDSAVYCSFSSEIQAVKIGDKITVKGRCIGYDELFEIVKLDQSFINP